MNTIEAREGSFDPLSPGIGRHSIHIRAVFQNLWAHQGLIRSMIRREMNMRYRGSFLGFLWLIVHPLLMLSIYTFFFGFVFRSPWQEGNGSLLELAIFLFSGLLIFNFFSECLTQAPNLILQNAHHVKRVIFPLETLAPVMIGAALFHTLLGILIIIILKFFLQGALSWSIFFLPVALTPLILFTAGLSWFLASLGVYFRDVKHLIGLSTLVMLFLSPIFYPLSVLPKALQRLEFFNPVAFAIEQVRTVLLTYHSPNFYGCFFHLLMSGLVAWLGFAWFQKTRCGFPDVL